MSKQCRNCFHVNGDDQIFCSSCGEPLDPELKMYMDLQHVNGDTKKKPQARPAVADEAVPAQREPGKKTHAWLVLGLVAVAALALFFVLR